MLYKYLSDKILCCMLYKYLSDNIVCAVCFINVSDKIVCAVCFISICQNVCSIGQIEIISPCLLLKHRLQTHSGKVQVFNFLIPGFVMLFVKFV